MFDTYYVCVCVSIDTTIMSTVKTFKYLSNPSTGDVAPGFKSSTPFPVSGKENKQRRSRRSGKQIRVSDGEKCVPPAEEQGKDEEEPSRYRSGVYIRIFRLT